MMRKFYKDMNTRRWDYGGHIKVHHSDAAFYLHPTQWFTISISLTTGAVNLEHLIKVCPSGFSSYSFPLHKS